MDRPIGGYFEIEKIGRGGCFPQRDGILLNTGRNALEYILVSIGNVGCVYVPYYTCEVILEPIKKLGISYRFYSIDSNFEICDNLQIKDHECLIYTNYYGVKDEYVRLLAIKFGAKLIVDNAQALFAEAIKDIKTIYSPRKYVGVPDGGIAYCSNGLDISVLSVDDSSDRMSHLYLRKEKGPQAGYADFRNNSRKLVMQPIRRMSAQTESLLNRIDFEEIVIIRRKNFEVLHRMLSDSNKFHIADFDTFRCPMVYPYWTDNDALKQKLIDNQIFVATYWPNVLEWCKPNDLEYDLAVHLLPLPIDQRYDAADMERIVELIKSN